MVARGSLQPRCLSATRICRSSLTKRMLILYCRRRTRQPHRTERPIDAVLALGSVRLSLPPPDRHRHDRPRRRCRLRRRRCHGRPERRRLARLDRNPRASSSARREFGAGRGSLVALFEGEPGSDARSECVPGGDRGLNRSARRRRPRSTASSAIARRATTASSARTATSAYVVVRLAITDEESVDGWMKLRALSTAAGRSSMCPARALHPGPGRQSEKELVQAETHIADPSALLILLAVFASLVAAGLPLLVAGLTIPTTLGRRLLLAQNDRALHLRPERRDDAGPGTRDRLFAVHGQPLPRGAAPRAVGRAAVEITVGPAGKAVAFSGSPWRSGSRGCSCSSRRRSARSASAARSWWHSPCSTR